MSMFGNKRADDDLSSFQIHGTYWHISYNIL